MQALPGVNPGVTAPPNNIVNVPQSTVLPTVTLAGSPGFVNSAQRTVYVFDADLAASNQSVCAGGCAQLWPSVAPTGGTALPSPWGSFARSDGATQLSYAGRALYTYAGDTRPGDTNGDGINSFGGLWHIARPQAAPQPGVPPTSAPTSTPVGGY